MATFIRKKIVSEGMETEKSEIIFEENQPVYMEEPKEGLKFIKKSELDGNFGNEENEQTEEEKPKRTRKPRVKKPENLLDGKSLIFFTDTILSRLSSLFVNSKTGKLIPYTSFQLTEEEKMHMLPIAERAAEKLDFAGDPLVMYGIVISMSYGDKLIQAITILNNSEKK